MRLRPAALAVILQLLTGLCPGQNQKRIYMDTGSERMLASADVAFAMNAAQSGIAQVQLGRLAITKTQNTDVKQFSQRMVADSAKANARLDQIAKQQDMTLPANMNAGDQAHYDRLQTLSGRQFDQVYMKVVLKDHEAAVKAFFREAKKGKDPAMRNFAAQNFDLLEQRLAAAKSIAAELMSSSS